MNRNAFFDIINARSAAYAEANAYDEAIRSASKACNAVIDGKQREPCDSHSYKIEEILRYGHKFIIKFTDGSWLGVTADDCEYDNEGLQYNERLSYDDAYKLGILTEELYGAWREACENKTSREKNTRGMTALQEAMTCLGTERIKELVK